MLADDGPFDLGGVFRPARSVRAMLATVFETFHTGGAIVSGRLRRAQRWDKSLDPLPHRPMYTAKHRIQEAGAPKWTMWNPHNRPASRGPGGAWRTVTNAA